MDVVSYGYRTTGFLSEANAYLYKKRLDMQKDKFHYINIYMFDYLS